MLLSQKVLEENMTPEDIKKFLDEEEEDDPDSDQSGDKPGY